MILNTGTGVGTQLKPISIIASPDGTSLLVTFSIPRSLFTSQMAQLQQQQAKTTQALSDLQSNLALFPVLNQAQSAP